VRKVEWMIKKTTFYIKIFTIINFGFSDQVLQKSSGNVEAILQGIYFWLSDSIHLIAVKITAKGKHKINGIIDQ